MYVMYARHCTDHLVTLKHIGVAVCVCVGGGGKGGMPFASQHTITFYHIIAFNSAMYFYTNIIIIMAEDTFYHVRELSIY